MFSFLHHIHIWHTTSQTVQYQQRIVMFLPYIYIYIMSPQEQNIIALDFG